MGTHLQSTWIEGVVDPDGEHIVISYGEVGEPRIPVALVGPGPGRSFTVQFMLKPDWKDDRVQMMLDEVRAELDFHLVELDEPDPWAYPRYHHRTAENACGSVHWSLRQGHECGEPSEQDDAIESNLHFEAEHRMAAPNP